jgi:hypothetical protein
VLLPVVLLVLLPPVLLLLTAPVPEVLVGPDEAVAPPLEVVVPPPPVPLPVPMEEPHACAPSAADAVRPTASQPMVARRIVHLAVSVKDAVPHRVAPEA